MYSLLQPFFFFFYLSCHTPAHKRAERKARNIAGAEALAVARRPEVASREKNPAAAGIRRFSFSLLASVLLSRPSLLQPFSLLTPGERVKASGSPHLTLILSEEKKVAAEG